MKQAGETNPSRQETTPSNPTARRENDASRVAALPNVKIPSTSSPSSSAAAPGTAQSAPSAFNSVSAEQQAASVPEDRIRQRAYELYVERGYSDGQAEEDWFRAEREIVMER